MNYASVVHKIVLFKKKNTNEASIFLQTQKQFNKYLLQSNGTCAAALYK